MWDVAQLSVAKKREEKEHKTGKKRIFSIS